MTEHIGVIIFLIALATFVFGVIGAILSEGTGALIGAIFGLVLAGGLILHQSGRGSDQEESFMRKEISNESYQAIASWRNTTCAMDEAIASASADGRILEEEAQPIWEMIRKQQRLEARRLVTDMKPTARCATRKAN